MRGKNASIILVSIIAIAASFQACKHEVDGAATDKILFNEARATDLIYYLNTPDITAPAGQSPHGDFRVRFNSIAAAALDTITGELPVGATFPEGSLIVKDVYESGSLSLYAIMKKATHDPLAGASWLWAEVHTDGAVVFSASKKGDGCISCHSSGDHRDLVRVVDLH